VVRDLLEKFRGWRVEQSFSVTILICVVLFGLSTALIIFFVGCFIAPFSFGRHLADFGTIYRLKKYNKRLNQVSRGSQVDWGLIVFVQDSIVGSKTEVKCRDHNLAVIEMMLTYYAGDLEALNLVELLGELLTERRAEVASLGEIVRSRGAVLGRIKSKGKSAPIWVKSEFGKREEDLKESLKANAQEINQVTSRLRDRISELRSEEVIQ